MQLKRHEAIEYFHNNTRSILDRILDKSKDGKGWICGIDGCKHGTHGDGLIIQKNNISNDYTLHCFSCGFHGDIFNFIGAYYHLHSFKEQLNLLCRMENIELINDIGEFDNNFRKLEKSNIDEALIPAKEELKDEKLEFYINALEGKDNRFKRLIEESQKRIIEPEPKMYLQKVRGLTEKSINYYGLGYTKNLHVGDRTIEQGIITPTSWASFCIRDMNPNVSQKDKIRKPKGAFDIPLGMKQVIENKDKKRNDINALEPIFIVEGLFDAPSVYEAGGDAVALNGVGAKSFIAIYKQYELKRPVLIALDSDDTGQSRQDKILDELKKSGIEAYPIELIPEKLHQEAGLKDANDYLLYDKEALKRTVETAKNKPYQEFLDGFNENQKEAYLLRIRANDRDKVKTGFKILDSEDFLDGGLDAGLIVMGALSALGKTTFSLQVADQLATAGNDVIFYSLEMSAHELRDKSISRYTAKEIINKGLLYKDVSSNDPKKRPSYNRFAKTQNQISHKTFTFTSNVRSDELEHVQKSIDQYFKDTGGHLRIVEGMGNIDADNIRALVEEHIKLTGRRPIVFIDYLQLLIQPKDENGRRRTMTDKQITDANIFRLKQLSRDYNIPIWAISSFNRDNYNNEVSMSSFKESGAIEYSADVLIGLERLTQDKNKLKAIMKNEKTTGKRELRLKLLKNRNGKSNTKIKFHYFPAFNYYLEISDEEAPLKWDDVIEDDGIDPENLFND